MKLRGRLIIAFLVIIIVPVILIFAVGGVIIYYQTNSIQQSYNVESDTFHVLSNPMQILNRVTRGVYNEIKLCALKTPEKLENPKYIEGLNAELKKKYSFIAVRKGKKFIFSGNDKELEMIEEYLPEFAVYSTDVDGGIYLGGKSSFLIKQQDFYFSDGEEGSIFVITDVNTLVPPIKSSAVQFIIAFILIICVTAGVLILWIYGSIVRPLNELRIAANKMQEGNLNFSIDSGSKDEIGMLCQDFEEMRIRLKELIETKLQYEKNTKELISNISHDLKTPLTAIKGYAEGLMDGVADTAGKQEKYLKTIYTKANDMTYLVDELSFYSKIDCDTVPYNFVNINVDDYFTDCMEEISLDLEVKNIEIEYINTADRLVKVIADVEQLKRVVNNIIGNSVKYIGNKRGLIKILIRDKENFIQIDIEDNGKGIAEKDINNIFERFYRTDASRNSSKGGSGLGLAISKKIIEDHGGTIWADSVEGEGTVIHFTLEKCDEFKEKVKNREEQCLEDRKIKYIVKE